MNAVRDNESQAIINRDSGNAEAARKRRDFTKGVSGMKIDITNLNLKVEVLENEIASLRRLMGVVDNAS